jgi:predicted aconitase with swiveling domain
MSVSTRVLSGSCIVGGHARGRALVSKAPICFSPEYFDLPTGTYLEKGHDLCGESLKGHILVFPHGRGFSGGAYCIYALAQFGTAPVGCIASRLESVSLIGMVMSHIPTVDRLDTDPFDAIRYGDLVELNADAGVVRVTAGTTAIK